MINIINIPFLITTKVLPASIAMISLVALTCGWTHDRMSVATYTRSKVHSCEGMTPQSEFSIDNDEYAVIHTGERAIEY